MTSELNSVINNICEKLGTTMDLLIPEMAGYSIARWSIGLVVGILFIAAGIFFFVKIARMRKNDGQKYYTKESIDKLFDAHDGVLTKNQINWEVRKVHYYEDDYNIYWFGAITSSLLGFVIFCIAITRIIGWALAPHAMMFQYILAVLGD